MKTVRHPNKIPFDGILTRLDVASDSAPAGARNHRIILTRQAAEDCLHTLLGMAVDYKAGWDGHDARQKCGVITKAWIEGDELWVSGHIFGRDFPETVEEMRKPDVDLGMSYELADAHIADMRASIWTVTATTFTGAAILLRHKAAYRSTKIRLIQAVAAAPRRKLRISGRVSRLRIAPANRVKTEPVSQKRVRCSPAPRRPRDRNSSAG